jgi:hypothetical protein
MPTVGLLLSLGMVYSELCKRHILFMYDSRKPILALLDRWGACPLTISEEKDGSFFLEGSEKKDRYHNLSFEQLFKLLPEEMKYYGVRSF